MNPGCKITCDMNNSSTKMLQIPRKMRGSNSKMLQTAVEMAASSANMLQIGRETDRTGDPKKIPTRKQNNSQNNSGPISSKRKDYIVTWMKMVLGTFYSLGTIRTTRCKENGTYSGEFFTFAFLGTRAEPRRALFVKLVCPEMGDLPSLCSKL